MVAEYKMSCSLKGLIPTIGLALETGNKYNHYSTFYHKTNSINYTWGQCSECGSLFIYKMNSKQDIHYFCSNSCAARNRNRQMHQKILQLAYKNVDKKAFSEWFLKYDGFARAKAYELCEGYSDLMNDVIDIWGENAIRHFFNIIKYEKIMRKEANNKRSYKYIEKAIYYAYLTAKSKRKKEIYYDECSIKVQQSILGDCNYED